MHEDSSQKQLKEPTKICQIMQLDHVFAAAKRAALLVMFVCIFYAFWDVSYFLRGNIFYTGKFVE